jgi:hypothetical protein
MIHLVLSRHLLLRGVLLYGRLHPFSIVRHHLRDLRLDFLDPLLLLTGERYVRRHRIGAAAVDLDELLRRELLFLWDKSCAKGKVLLCSSVVVVAVMTANEATSVI